MSTSSSLVCVRRKMLRMNLPSIASVVRQELQADGRGGNANRRDTVVLENLRARVTPMARPQIALEGGQVNTIADTTILLMPELDSDEPGELDVMIRDVIVVGSRRYAVVGTDAGTDEAVCLNCRCRRLVWQ